MTQPFKKKYFIGLPRVVQPFKVYYFLVFFNYIIFSYNFEHGNILIENKTHVKIGFKIVYILIELRVKC